MKKLLTGFFVLALAIFSSSAMARNTEMFNPPEVKFSSQNEETIKKVHDRIVDAGRSLGWMVVKDEAGEINLYYDKQGKHQVTIAVKYDTSGYQISYLSSVNLNFVEEDGVRKIHPAYNRWVRNLMKNIDSI